MSAQILYTISTSNSAAVICKDSANILRVPRYYRMMPLPSSVIHRRKLNLSVHCLSNQTRTCKNCKTQFDSLLNHPLACRYHTAHFGGETKRKFESVHSGGTMDTPDGGKVFQYWHCCGSEDPFDIGCTAVPHASYDD